MFAGIKRVVSLTYKLKTMKKLLITNGEIVEVTTETRDLGHGVQVKVIYSDGTEGWEHLTDLQD